MSSSNLPIELRLTVYQKFLTKASTVPPTFVRISPHPITTTLQVQTSRVMPPLLSTESISRLETTKLFRYAFGHIDFRSQLFNFSIDALHLLDTDPARAEAAANANDSTLVFDFAYVQHLAIYGTVPQLGEVAPCYFFSAANMDQLIAFPRLRTLRVNMEPHALLRNRVLMGMIWIDDFQFELQTFWRDVMRPRQRVLGLQVTEAPVVSFLGWIEYAGFERELRAARESRECRSPDAA